jgi:hypothetical protein
MMFTNPLRDKKVIQKDFRSIHICCVVNDLSDANNTAIREIRDHCHKLDILFSTRVFNSFVNADDKNYIEKLPAFHIYTKTSYLNTMYITDNLIQYMNEYITSLYIKRDSTISLKERIIRIFKKAHS